MSDKKQPSSGEPATVGSDVGVKPRMQTPMEVFFPDGRIYEFLLQRLRLVASEKGRVLRVDKIQDAPHLSTDVPKIEVTIRIPGLKITNPVTGKPMMLTAWLKQYFEGEHSQKGFLDAIAEYLGESIPVDHPEAHLKRKFEQYRDGAPGDLPPRATLYAWKEALVQQLAASRDWLRNLKRPKQEFNKRDREAFLKEIELRFWWATYVRRGEITLRDIARQSPPIRLLIFWR